MAAMTPQMQQATPPEKRGLPIACIIDDSPTIRAVVGVALTNDGYKVLEFASGEDFLKWAIQTPEMPVIVLLDIELPGIDGYVIAANLKRSPRYQNIPLIMLSARDSATDRLKARVAGAQKYLIKPFTVQTLREAVKMALSNSLNVVKQAPQKEGK